MPVSMAVLVQCPLFAELPPRQLGAVAERMQIISLRRREVLGGPKGFSGMGVVLSGSVQSVEETADGREVVLATVEPYQTLGLAELLAQPLALPTWVAAGMGTAVGALERVHAMEVLQQSELAWSVARSLAQRICDLQGMQKILSIHSVPSRLAVWLHWQCGGQDGEIRLPTHAELAWQLNTTRESVTRVLQRLSADGLLRREGEAWRVVNADALLGWGPGTASGTGAGGVGRGGREG
jgi:CRP-like cAMP-binding protein